MKILSWNVRGLGGVKKRRLVRECLSNFKKDIVILQETKKKVMGGSLVQSSIGLVLSEWCVLPAIDTSGGILLTRNPFVIRKKDSRLGLFSISLMLEDISLGVDWLLTWVYGLLSRRFVVNFGRSWLNL